MFKGKCGTEGTVQRLAVLTVLTGNLLEENRPEDDRAAAMRREMDLTLRGCRGATTQRIADGIFAACSGSGLN